MAVTGEMAAPFQRGDLVICGLSYLTVRAGQKVRVISCVLNDDCESGWIVSATNQTRGRMRAKPAIALQGIDSGWFAKPKENQ